MFIRSNSLIQRLSNIGLHPATRLVLWVAILLSVQFVGDLLLSVALGFLLLLPLPVLRRGLHLVWRTRWLLLSLFAVFSWGVAGQPLWSGVTAPTREGIRVAAPHLLRLILVLMLVAAFLEKMKIADLLSATHFLFKPLRRVGFDVDRGVIRLMLVLRYAENLPRARDWRSLLDAPQSFVAEWVEIDQSPFRFRDAIVLVVTVVLIAYFVFC